MSNLELNKEWRSWIWIVLFIMGTNLSAGLSLYIKAEDYTDDRISDIRSELNGNISDIRDDIKIIQTDIKKILANKN